MEVDIQVHLYQLDHLIQYVFLYLSHMLGLKDRSMVWLMFIMSKNEALH